MPATQVRGVARSPFDDSDLNLSRTLRVAITGVPGAFTTQNNLTMGTDEVAFIDKITLRAVTNDANTNFKFTIEINGEELYFNLPGVLDSRRGDGLVLEPGGNMVLQPGELLRVKASTALLGTFTIKYRKYTVGEARMLGLLDRGYPLVASTNTDPQGAGAGLVAGTAKEIVTGVAGHSIEILGFYLTGHSYNAAADSIALGFWDGVGTFFTPPSTKATGANMVFVGHTQGAAITYAPEILVNNTHGCIQGPAGSGLFIEATTNIAGGTPTCDYVVMYRLVKVPDQSFLMDMRLNATYSGGAVTSIVMTEAIPTDTAATGTVNVQRADGQITAIAYSAYSGSTFTITSTNFSANNAVAGGTVTFNRPQSYVNDPTGAIGQPVRRRTKWWASTIAAPTVFVDGNEVLPGIFGSYSSSPNYRVAFDGQTANLAVNDVLTFSGGGTATLTAVSDAGATGAITFTMLTGSVPANNETFTGAPSAGDGTVNGTPVIGSAITEQDSLVKVRGYAGSFIEGRPSLTGVSGMQLGSIFGTATSFLGNIGLTDANPNGADVDTSTHVCEPDELVICNLSSHPSLTTYEFAAGEHPARFQLAWGEFAQQKNSGNFNIQMS